MSDYPSPEIPADLLPDNIGVLTKTASTILLEAENHYLKTLTQQDVETWQSVDDRNKDYRLLEGVPQYCKDQRSLILDYLNGLIGFQDDDKLVADVSVTFFQQFQVPTILMVTTMVGYKLGSEPNHPVLPLAHRNLKLTIVGNKTDRFDVVGDFIPPTYMLVLN